MRTRIGLIGLAAAALVACNKPSDFDGDGFTADVDCNDNDATIHPEAAEVCDGVDNNCDNSIDGADADGAVTFYGDQDADGYGGMDISVTQCDMPSGFVDNAEDCNDVNADVNPDAAEICDGADNDCDGLTDDEDDSVDTSGYSAFYSDADGDGYGNADVSVDACNAPSGYADNAEDCDDTDATVSPESVWYSDVDGDGFGSETFSVQSCDMPSGYVSNTDDCNDTDGDINPDATEICDGGIDNDCDGASDDDDDSVDSASFNTFYSDADADGYGDDAMTVMQCALPSGYSADGGDCDDAEPLANPGETEICDDGIDNDCSGDAPECGLLPIGNATDATLSLTGGSSAGSTWGRYRDGIQAGDFNNDGITDLAISDYSNNSYRGAVDFFYGPISSAPSPVTLSNDDGSYSYSAYNIAGLGDVDGDGGDDILVGAKYADNDVYQAGGAFLVSGPTSNGFYEDEMIAFAGPGYWAETYSYHGEGVGALGDMNGDGYQDFAVGGDGYDGFGYSSGGAVFFYLGSASPSGILEPDFATYGEASYMYMGGYGQIDGAGDLDGDGYDDAVFGSTGDGYAYVLYGANSVSTWGGSWGASTSDVVLGSGGYGYGWGVGEMGDVNDDGYDDFYVGDNSADEMYIYFGASSWLSSGASADVTIDHSVGSSSNIATPGLISGDFNNDGVSDVVAADYYYGASTTGLGGVFTMYGPLSAGSYDAYTDNDSYLTGDPSTSYDYFGYGVAGADVTGDGIDDLLVSTPGEQTLSIFSGGGL